MAFLAKLIPFGLFILGCIWVLLFPLINITSGELKPRGIYVDEHALLVNSELYKSNSQSIQDYSHIRKNPTDICVNLKDSYNVFCTSPIDQVTQIILEPFAAKVVYESTVLVVPYLRNSQCSVQHAIELVDQVIRNIYHVEWLTKRVVLLMIPSDGEQQASRILRQWLNRQHKPTNLDLSIIAKLQVDDKIPPIGIIREAYVLDLFSSAQCDQGKPFEFEQLLLQHIGRHGVQPNMDMVAYPLAIHKGILQVHSQHCSAVALGAVGDWLRPDARPAVRLLNKVWQELSKDIKWNDYRRKLFALLCSIYSHVIPSTGSLHPELLHFNIDSVTLAIRPNTETQNMLMEMGLQNEKKRRNKKNKNQGKLYNINKAVEIALSLVYISNNLHEELHHSHFYYLLIGSDTFVGISEYGFTAGVFLLSCLAQLYLIGDGASLDAVFMSMISTVAELLPLTMYLLSFLYSGFGTRFIEDAGLHLCYTSGAVLFLLTYMHKAELQRHGHLISKMANYQFVALIVLSFVFSLNFPLGLTVAISTIPTLLTAAIHVIYCPRSVLRESLILALCILHSPGGLMTFDAALHLAFGGFSPLRDMQAVYLKDDAFSYPVIMIMNTLASYYCLVCLFALRSGQNKQDTSGKS